MKASEFTGAVRAALANWQTTFGHPAAGIAPGSVPVFYPNGPEVDEASVGPVWVDLEFRFYSGKLAEIGSDTNRSTGVIAVSVYTKQGEGTIKEEAILRSLRDLLPRKRWGSAGVTLGFERMTSPPDFYGWRRAGVMVSFYFNETN